MLRFYLITGDYLPFEKRVTVDVGGVYHKARHTDKGYKQDGDRKADVEGAVNASNEKVLWYGTFNWSVNVMYWVDPLHNQKIV